MGKLSQLSTMGAHFILINSHKRAILLRKGSFLDRLQLLLLVDTCLILLAKKLMIRFVIQVQLAILLFKTYVSLNFYAFKHMVWKLNAVAEVPTVLTCQQAPHELRDCKGRTVCNVILWVIHSKFESLCKGGFLAIFFAFCSKA